MTDVSPKEVIEDLGDGLIMRAARREDANHLADFCAKVFVHEESGTEAYWIANWIRDLINNPHPTLNVDDVIVVEDVKNDRIASTTTYLSQTWTYDGIEFEIGRPEIVGTAREYRNRGLIRKQFDVMHRWALQREHLVQVVLGIPSYYRQFGYEYALHAEGGRCVSVASLPTWGDEQRKYRLRDAVKEDVPFITRLLNASAKRSLVSPSFNENEVDYITFGRTPQSGVCHRTGILCKSEGENFGQPVAAMMYTITIEIDLSIILRLEMMEARYWREALHALLKEFAEMVETASKATKDPEREIKLIRQNMQPDHPVYIFDDGALGAPLERQYGWYVRVPNVAGFIRKIGPVLERRVADSIHVGLTTELNIKFNRDGLVIIWEGGKIQGVKSADRLERGEANACFPELTFLPVLFGMSSVDEVVMSRIDATWGNKVDHHLMNTLFPKRSSDLSLTLT